MKQVIVIRKDLNMRKGKMVAQGCHASSEICMKFISLADFPMRGGSNGEKLVDWFRQWTTQHAHTKICVSVDSLDELMEVYRQAREAGLPVSLIQDIGKTEFNGQPTYTTVGIGPAPSELIDPITGHLKLL